MVNVLSTNTTVVISTGEGLLGPSDGLLLLWSWIVVMFIESCSCSGRIVLLFWCCLYCFVDAVVVAADVEVMQSGEPWSFIPLLMLQFHLLKRL